MGPPVTFELKVRGQNRLRFWNNSIRPASGTSFSKIGRPTFSTSGRLSQTMSLKNDHTYELIEANISTGANEKKNTRRSKRNTQIVSFIVLYFFLCFPIFLSYHVNLANPGNRPQLDTFIFRCNVKKFTKKRSFRDDASLQSK